MKRSTPSSFKQPHERNRKPSQTRLQSLNVRSTRSAGQLRWNGMKPQFFNLWIMLHLRSRSRTLSTFYSWYGYRRQRTTKRWSKNSDKRIKLSCTFWPQAQQIGPTKSYVTLLRINNVMLVVLFALTILGLEYGVMMEESFTLETFP